MTQLRKQFWKDQDLGEHVRDVQRALNKVPNTQIKVVECALTTNLTIQCDAKPVAIEAIRIQFKGNDTPVPSHGTAVDFVWRPDLGGALITGIQGLTAGTTVYRFTFRLTYEA